MKTWLALFLAIANSTCADTNVPVEGPPAPARTVYVLPIREDIMPPLVYLVRRGVKEAMEAGADLLVIHMNTDGGRLDVTEEIIGILDKFEGLTVTYVDDRAFSAGAFIAAATREIYMAPKSVIGAAAPIMMAPGGGVENMPSTYEIKMNSAVRALVRRQAEENGHNVDVLEAMIDKNKELVIDGEVLKEKDDILTLTDTEAAKEYGDPPKPLLSAGTVESLDALIDQLGFAGATRVDIQPTGAEKIGFWINMISPILLMIGIIGLYIEFKTPGFGLPGIVGIAAIAIYFLGGYVAGLSGMEWLLVFALGVVLVVLELFVFPGTIILGLTGAAMMLLAIVMALVDAYPASPDAPSLPGLPALPEFAAGSFERAFRTLFIALVGSFGAAWILSKYLPQTSLFHALSSRAASGSVSVTDMTEKQASRLGQVGVTISALRPGGTARFGDQILDVMSQGELIEKGRKVRIIRHSLGEAVVEVAE